MPKQNSKAEEARKMYEAGKKLVEIAQALGVPPGTVRRWKSTYKWDGERSNLKSERSGKKSERSHNKINDKNILFFIALISFLRKYGFYR